MRKELTRLLPQESLNGDMKEMIKFTYELKCFKDALDIKVYIYLVIVLLYIRGYIQG